MSQSETSVSWNESALSLITGSNYFNLLAHLHMPMATCYPCRIHKYFHANGTCKLLQIVSFKSYVVGHCFFRVVSSSSFSLCFSRLWSNESSFPWAVKDGASRSSKKLCQTRWDFNLEVVFCCLHYQQETRKSSQGPGTSGYFDLWGLLCWKVIERQILCEMECVHLPKLREINEKLLLSVSQQIIRLTGLFFCLYEFIWCSTQSDFRSVLEDDGSNLFLQAHLTPESSVWVTLLLCSVCPN